LAQSIRILSVAFGRYRLYKYGTEHGLLKRATMARQTHRLTSISVAKSKGPGLYGDGAGLYLRIGPRGTKSWIFRYRHDGKLRDMGLGSVQLVTLAEARAAAQEQSKAVLAFRQGAINLDPIGKRKEQRAALKIEAAKGISFRQCADRYIAAHKAGWRNAKHRGQWTATLETYAYPVFGDVPVQAIDTGLVLKAVEPLWTTKTETASRVRGRIEAILDWATAREYRRGENPARWRGHIEKILPKKADVHRVEHRAALPYGDIGGFMAELRTQEGIGARALEFAILTAARTIEVIGARWEEFDLDERTWTVPASRMKSGREHRVPLSNAALAIVKAMAAIRQNDLVFPGMRAGRLLSHMTMLNVLRRMGRDSVTPHGFRSTFRDWAAERTSFPGEVAEMALAHIVGDKVEAAYRRGDLFQKRRQLADAWAKYCISPPTPAEVLPLRWRL
jgi:integrase